jgi:hypothetical protein
MRSLLIAVLFVGSLSIIARANAADGCGPGCHATLYGACVVDGWDRGRHVRNECPAGSRPRPPCGPGYTWKSGGCFPT